METCELVYIALSSYEVQYCYEYFEMFLPSGPELEILGLSSIKCLIFLSLCFTFAHKADA